MKKIFLSLALLSFASLSFADEAFLVRVTNNWTQPRKAVPVEWTFKKAQQILGYKNITASVDGVEIPAQLDDLDGDGKADAFCFLIDLDAQSSKEVRVVCRREPAVAQPEPKVYAEMLLSDKKGHKPIQSLSVPDGVDVYNNLHHHGPAFENELVAFRLYFDHRQTVDIYGKRRKGLEIEDTQFYPTPEQLAAGYGDDILWAGTTVSVGSFRGFVDNQPTFIQPVEMRTERILSYGPVRTVVEIVDKGWDYQGQKLNMTQRYTLYAGHRDMHVDVNVKAEENIASTFCTGVLKFPGGDEMMDGRGLAATWGSNWAAGPKDTLNRVKETLGVAVCVPEKQLSGAQKEGENLLYLFGGDRNYSIAGKASLTVPAKEMTLSYDVAFCSDKEEWEGSIHSSRAWFDWAYTWKEELQQSVIVRLKKVMLKQ